jgi:hypothetical protein
VSGKVIFMEYYFCSYINAHKRGSHTVKWSDKFMNLNLETMKIREMLEKLQ